jgi:hypothetical protein
MLPPFFKSIAIALFLKCLLIIIYFFLGTGGGGGGILPLFTDLGAMLGGGGGTPFLNGNPFDNGLSFVGIGGGGVKPVLSVLVALPGGGGVGFKLSFLSATTFNCIKQ